MLCYLCLGGEAVDAEGLCKECIDAEVSVGDKRIALRDEQEKKTLRVVTAPKKKSAIWGGGDV